MMKNSSISFAVYVRRSRPDFDRYTFHELPICTVVVFTWTRRSESLCVTSSSKRHGSKGQATSLPASVNQAAASIDPARLRFWRRGAAALVGPACTSPSRRAVGIPRRSARPRSVATAASPMTPRASAACFHVSASSMAARKRSGDGCRSEEKCVYLSPSSSARDRAARMQPDDVAAIPRWRSVPRHEVEASTARVSAASEYPRSLVTRGT